MTCELRNKRVLLIFPHMVMLGGAITYTLKLAELLASSGAAVGIVTLRADRSKFLLPEGVELICPQGPLTSSLSFWLRFFHWQRILERCISTWQPDAIVPQVFPSNWWGWLYKRHNPAVPLVWVCHEPSAFIHSPEWINGLKPFWKRWLAKALQPLLVVFDLRLARQADRVVVNSRFTAQRFEQVYGRKSDGVAYPGVDFSIFNPDNSSRDQALITVTHLTRYKRVDFLLRVFARLKERNPELVYHVVGDGDEAEALRGMAQELNIADGVRFHGRLSHFELARLNRRALLFLHGGINETFGMAPLEAIACGTPVVAHASGGPQEFVTESCGRLVHSLDAAVWANEIDAYLAYLRKNPEYLDKVHENAGKFDWRISLTPALEVIADLCSRPQSELQNRSI